MIKFKVEVIRRIGKEEESVAICLEKCITVVTKIVSLVSSLLSIYKSLSS